MEDKNLYRTTNFQIAVWLMVNDITLLDIDEADVERKQFIFQDFDARKTLIDTFFEQTQLRKFISKSQELKERMYASNSPKKYDRNK